MKKIAIITYHSAYNYGSVFQALATQKFLNRHGYEATILNYRMPQQKYVYSAIRVHSGIRAFVKDCLSGKDIFKKLKRKDKFESFISQHFDLTDEFSNPEMIHKYVDNFDVYLSGSDQIWNKHSNELHSVDWKYMEPYVYWGVDGKKISYASSIGNMIDQDELEKLGTYLSDFSHISMREPSAAEKIMPYIKIKPDVVLDPTFLLDRQEWNSVIETTNDSDKYILFYSLAGVKVLKKAVGLVEDFARKGYKVKYITPYAINLFERSDSLEDCLDAGPVEFMNLLVNASYIVTDSYHGTILSINHNKEFFSLNGEFVSDSRKTDVLNELGLINRSISWNSSYDELDFHPIDYTLVNKRLSLLREKSKQYLINAIEY